MSFYTVYLDKTKGLAFDKKEIPVLYVNDLRTFCVDYDLPYSLHEKRVEYPNSYFKFDDVIKQASKSGKELKIESLYIENDFPKIKKRLIVESPESELFICQTKDVGNDLVTRYIDYDFEDYTIIRSDKKDSSCTVMYKPKSKPKSKPNSKPKSKPNSKSKSKSKSNKSKTKSKRSKVRTIRA